MRNRSAAVVGLVVGLLAFSPVALAQGQGGRGGAPPAPTGPWSDKSLSPDQRADLVIAQMTLDEKIQLLHGGTMAGRGGPAPQTPSRSNGGAGWVPGIERLGMPDINMADSAVGVTRGSMTSRYSTLLPSALGAAATWNTDLALLYGQVIGRELRDQGYNMSIGGGVNITREPRNGRNFEYAGEDPILAGTTVGTLMKGVQSQQIMGDLKHYALNDQETGRNIGNVLLDKRAMRESDLLAFQIAYRISDAAGFMCSYNKLNGDWACENDYLLNQVLKKDFGFKGWVMSDWGGTHSTTKAIMAGLDQEEPGSGFFGDALKKAVEDGEVPVARINDAVHRILRSMFAVGVWDNPPNLRRVVDVFKGLDDAQKIAEESIVLLKNAGNQLPLSAAAVKSIAVIGSHADVGVPSGGGSAQVSPPGGNAVVTPAGAVPAGFGRGGAQYFPTPPLKFIRAKAPGAKVDYNDGTDPAAAAALAKAAQVAIVFVNQPMSEGRDAATMTLPEKQDDLVNAVAAANPHTIVVAETGGPVAMPWADKVSGILEAWFPGVSGGPAIANILFGDVNPSAKLPASFARSDSDLPHPLIPGLSLMPEPGAGRGAAGAPPTAGRGGGMARGGLPPFDIPYTEKLEVGYKWFDAENKEPLFPFGHGLSYATYAYSGLKASASGHNISVSFTVKNTGKRAGKEVAQVYATLPASTGEPPKRLIGWQKVDLAPGESKTVNLPIDPLYISIFNEGKDSFEVAGGDYKIWAGASSRNLPLSQSVKIAD
ncbi:MAG TPA: glycoside hydrolase family 3 C-terminal domain-containing protein [Bryobacteraceae bacterium]|nr:glycoside hydrolase family 3 C-terminal domain-containing protein [Bryobacteraceae bacterium]